MHSCSPFYVPYCAQKKEEFFMAGKKTGKRLLTWVLVLVMALSLLPLNALAEDIPTEYNPTIKWPGGLIERTVNVTLFYENENTKLGTVSSKGYGTTPTITVPSGIEVYKSETSSGCTYAANIFTFWNIADKSGDLKLYTRSTAGQRGIRSRSSMFSTMIAAGPRHLLKRRSSIKTKKPFRLPRRIIAARSMLPPAMQKLRKTPSADWL